MSGLILQTDYKEFPLFSRGKVRDIYDIGEHLLVITTDRISAFDHILPQGIPYKGMVLNLISAFWFEATKNIVDNHLVSCSVSDLPEKLRKYERELKGRFMIVKKAKMLPIECVVRGYISGSAWAEYKKSGSISGIKLRENLKESEHLDEVLFTPSTKAESGHDINISYEEMENIIGKEKANLIRELSIKIYKFASAYAMQKGIIIADTKFEFGIFDEKIILCDEILTPDSSRFWPSSSYEIGKPQPSFDKQFVRDYLLQIGWKKEPPIPDLPEDVVKKTSEKYIEAYERLTGKKFPYEC